MPDSSYEGRHRRPGRHRAPRNQAPRLTAGVALPTAAAAALTLTATGAAVATHSAPQNVSFTGNAALAERAHGQAEAQAQHQQDLQRRRQQVAEETAAAAARQASAERAARDRARQALAEKRAAAAVARAHRWEMPVDNAPFTSGFGGRWGRMHEGDDFGVPVGTDLKAMSTGEVVFAGAESGFGTIVKIRYWDGTESW